jgi:N-acetylglucosaminyldiphosphoundecaprenol N-acetyl-beta-D-mannosaminyltransferase
MTQPGTDEMPTATRAPKPAGHAPPAPAPESRATSREPRTTSHEFPPPVHVWGLPLAPLSMAGTLAAIDQLIASGRPAYLITANLHYAMLTHAEPDLDAINAGAALVLADGMPLVWAARGRLPGRVPGSDLIFAVAARAATRGHRLFLLGGAPGVGQRAAENLRARAPGLNIVGIEAPILADLGPDEEAALIGRIRAARPDILLAALSQPAGERWLARHCEALGVPVCAQIGAALDFAAGRVRRAPRWMQRIGLEWAFRLILEPCRLGPRYLRNALFLARRLTRDLLGRDRDPSRTSPGPR